MSATFALPSLARQWHDAGRQARVWGWPFALGAASLAISGAAALLWLPAVRQETDSLAASADRAEHRARLLHRQARTVASTLPPRARYLAGFPVADARQARLGVMLSLAAAQHLEPRTLELKLSSDRELGLLRYTVNLPVTGTYPQLRTFIAAAESSDPALSLDHLRLHRASPSTPAVEADLAWTFYMQPESPPR